MMDVIGKKELLVRMKRFLADRRRGVSVVLFAELCGVSDRMLVQTFKDERFPVSEQMQIRVSRALLAWERGDYEVVKGFGGVKYLVPRKVPKPAFRRFVGLKVEDGRIRIDCGVRRRADTSRVTFKEQMNKR